MTDKRHSYGAARRKVLPGVEHRQIRHLNNRAEVSHQPTRRRERQIRQRGMRNVSCPARPTTTSNSSVVIA
ncbi:MAG: hypothetical protein ACRYG8_14835 [Janthinobacterium lividum]